MMLLMTQLNVKYCKNWLTWFEFRMPWLYPSARGIAVLPCQNPVMYARAPVVAPAFNTEKTICHQFGLNELNTRYAEVPNDNSSFGMGSAL